MVFQKRAPFLFFVFAITLLVMIRF